MPTWVIKKTARREIDGPFAFLLLKMPGYAGEPLTQPTPALYCESDRYAVDLRTLESVWRNPDPALGLKPVL